MVSEIRSGQPRRYDPDFLIAVQKGLVPGHSLVHKFGRNDAVANGSWEMISLLSAATSKLSAPTTVRIKAGGDAADDVAGAGAREFTIQGIDTTLAEVSEALVTNGASASSATTKSWWRIHRAWVSAVGTYAAANTDDITIEDSAGAADLMVVAAGEGQSQHAGWTVPTGKTAYLLGALATVDANKAADIRMMTMGGINTTVAPFSSPRIRRYWDGVAGTMPLPLKSPAVGTSALSDIWFEAQGSGSTAEVSVEFELLVIEDGY